MGNCVIPFIQVWSLNPVLILNNVLDFASSSFDAILFPNAPVEVTVTTQNDGEIKRRSSHLPDLIPFIQLITDKCDVQPIHMVMALMYVQRFRNSLPSGKSYATDFHCMYSNISYRL